QGQQARLLPNKGGDDGASVGPSTTAEHLLLPRIGSAIREQTGRRMAARPIPEPWFAKEAGCVALALREDMPEMVRLAFQCLELLASQSVTAVNDIMSHDVIESLTAQLHTYEMNGFYPTQVLAGKSSSKKDSTGRSAANIDDGLGLSAQTAKRKRAATRLQRQCISVLSGLALNSTGSTMRLASREVVERAILFLAAFHWSKSVRAEAKLALRRLQSKRSLPHPTSWGVQDCLQWLSCVDLDEMCSAAHVFLYDYAADDPRPGLRIPWRVIGSSGSVASRSSRKAPGTSLDRQVSGTSSTTRKTNLVSSTDDATEISIPRQGARAWERSQQQQWHENDHPQPAPVMAQCATTGACRRSGPDASGVNSSRRNSTINRNISSSWLEPEGAAIGLQRKTGT
ncbi:unnamed protein product, partial [Ectocarpus sp. 12 AP-2014]